MKWRASSRGRMVRPKGPIAAHRSCQATNREPRRCLCVQWAGAGDGGTGAGVMERVAAIATLGEDGASGKRKRSMRWMISSVIPPTIARSILCVAVASGGVLGAVPRMRWGLLRLGRDLIYECDVDTSHPYQRCSQRCNLRRRFSLSGCPPSVTASQRPLESRPRACCRSGADARQAHGKPGAAGHGTAARMGVRRQSPLAGIDRWLA